MRTRSMILIGALLLVFAGAAQAQQEQTAALAPPSTAQTQGSTTPADTPTLTPKLGRVDFGFRGNSVTGDQARYNRYQDLRQGAYLDRFRFEKETGGWFAQASADNVGYRDQRFGGEFTSIGRMKLTFNWDQIPLYISDATRGLYVNQGNGVLTIDDSIQSNLQNAGAPTSPAVVSALTTTLAGASQFDMRSHRYVGDLRFRYTVSRDVDLKFAVKNTTRNGYNLMSFGFGTSPGLNPAVELGVPTDDRATDIKGGLEYANDRGMLAVGYTGSWYDNSIPLVRFDNPLRVTDISGGPSAGQAVLWPSNTSAALNVNGSYKLPVRSRATAAISVGRWTQDETLAPATINTALVSPTLERATAETKANIVSMVYGLNSRPTDYLWLNAKFRYYDYSNRTPAFESPALLGDWSLDASNRIWEIEPASWNRQNLDLDASFAPLDYLSLGAGYGHEGTDHYVASQTGITSTDQFRIFSNTAEDTFRVTADSTGNQYVTLRLKYEHSRRTGSGFDEELLDEVGEQPDMRHYDIADRDRDRTTALLSITPVPFLDLNGSVGIGRDDYRNTGFGLRDNKNRTWNAGFDVVPSQTVTFGINYGYEKYTALQYSRSANPLSATDQTFLDPRRDWWTDQGDTVKTISANLDLLKALPKTDVRVGYDRSDGDATYVYNLRPDQTLFTTVPLAQLSRLKNQLTDGHIDVQYYLRANLALGAAYWYDAYDVFDFSLNDTTINQLNPVTAAGASTNAIYTGYLYSNYTIHTGYLRLTYLW